MFFREFERVEREPPVGGINHRCLRAKAADRSQSRRPCSLEERRPVNLLPTTAPGWKVRSLHVCLYMYVYSTVLGRGWLEP